MKQKSNFWYVSNNEALATALLASSTKQKTKNKTKFY